MTSDEAVKAVHGLFARIKKLIILADMSITLISQIFYCAKFKSWVTYIKLK